MRNCPREDLGGPFQVNPSFDLSLGRTSEWRVRQCAYGLISDRSRALLELFFDCHSAEAGWEGPVYRQIGWPTAQTLFEEHYLVVQAFRVIRGEIASVMDERRK